jgi:acyl-CoA reductase-like NAD-dependent aldehyde dehydrogenase
MRYVLGVEAMQSGARSDRTGLCIIERAPWGVIGMVLPATHSVPTMVSNAVNILAAGNTAVFSPHGRRPRGGWRCSSSTDHRSEIGVSNVTRPSLGRASRPERIFRHPDVAAVSRQGCGRESGGAVSKAHRGQPRQPAGRGRRGCGSRTCSPFDHRGAAFDNNLCIGEKEVFVVEAVADDFAKACRRRCQPAPRRSRVTRRPSDGPQGLRAAHVSATCSAGRHGL